MDLLELPSLGSMPMDMALPSPWDSDKVMAEALWQSSTHDGLETTVASSETTTDTPYYSSGNAYGPGASWSVQALKCSESSSETSTVLVETSSWAPTCGSCVQSSDSGSESLPAPLEVSAEAAASGRMVRRSRARRNPHVDSGSGEEQEQAHCQHRHSAAQVQTLEPTMQAPPRPDWAFNRGPTLSGIVRPFESVKGNGIVSGSRTLQEINMALKKWQPA